MSIAPVSSTAVQSSIASIQAINPARSANLLSCTLVAAAIVNTLSANPTVSPMARRAMVAAAMVAVAFAAAPPPAVVSSRMLITAMLPFHAAPRAAAVMVTAPAFSAAFQSARALIKAANPAALVHLLSPGAAALVRVNPTKLTTSPLAKRARSAAAKTT